MSSVLRSFAPLYKSCLSPSMCIFWLLIVIVAEDLCSYGSGIGPWKWPRMFISCWRGMVKVSLKDVRGLRFFSPSKLAVSMNAVPLGNDEPSSIKSAGKVSSFLTMQISPTKTSLHLTLLYRPFLMILANDLKLSTRSALYLWKSSYPYRVIDMPMTIISGAQAVKGLSGDMISIESKIATTKK